MTNFKHRMVRLLAALTSSILLLTFALPAARAATETLSVYTDSGNNDQPMLVALVKAFERANPNIHVILDVGPAGVDSVASVKARLASGKMDDAFIYFSGSLFQSLNPTKYLVDLADQPWQKNVVSSFIPTVSVGPRIYGAPIGSAMGGGILYNKTIYQKLGLKIPVTWSQFMQNNAKIKKAGIVPVIQTYKDSWTSQLLVLADEYNLQAVNPNFPALYTAKKAGFRSTPAAFAGFQHLEEIHKSGYQNKDFASATLAQGIRYLVTGVGAQYPMFTAVASNIQKDYPALADTIGLFALPGLSSASNGLTVWMPTGLFISKATKHLTAAKKFLAFATSSSGISAIEAAVPLTGPYLVKGITLKSNLSTITKDMLRYVTVDGKTAPALEFVSPIKGPNLAKITVQVGSGLLSAKQGAVLYDKDVQKELVRLGLPGWGKFSG